MLISTKGRYALRVMLELASQTNGEWLSLPAIAQRQGISEKYLESIVSLLVKGGLIEGQRGKHGGYRLARPAAQCSVGEVLRLTEGSLAPVACLDGKKSACPRAGTCQTLPVWENLDALISNYLNGVTILDLAEGRA